MGRPRKFDENAALEAARDTFWTMGYEGASLAALTEAMGIGAQSLYNTFGSKRELYVRVVETYSDEREAGLATALDESTTPWESLVAVVTFRDAARSPLPAEGCLLVKSNTETGVRVEGVRSRATLNLDTTLVLVEECIDRARRHGDLDTAFDTRELALAATVVMQGMEYLTKLELDDELASDMRRTCVAMLERMARGGTTRSDVARAGHLSGPEG